MVHNNIFQHKKLLNQMINDIEIIVCNYFAIKSVYLGSKIIDCYFFYLIKNWASHDWAVEKKKKIPQFSFSFSTSKILSPSFFYF